MAWIYLAASEGSVSLSNPGLEQQHIVRETSTLKPCCCREFLMDGSTELRYGMTLHRSTGPCYLASKSFLPAFLVKTSVLLDVAKVWLATEAAFIGSCIDSLLNASQLSFSLKTCQRLEPAVLEKWSGHLPRSGMIVGGHLFQPLKLVPSIFVNDGSYLPTPTACDYGKNNGRNSTNPMKSRDRWSITVRASRGDLPLHPKGRLNPAWTEQAMGFPLMWTEIDAAVMPWFQSKRKRRSKDCVV